MVDVFAGNVLHDGLCACVCVCVCWPCGCWACVLAMCAGHVCWACDAGNVLPACHCAGYVCCHACSAGKYSLCRLGDQEDIIRV